MRFHDYMAKSEHVQHPGAHGSTHWYIGDQGEVVYGRPEHRGRPVKGAAIPNLDEWLGTVTTLSPKHTKDYQAKWYPELDDIEPEPFGGGYSVLRAPHMHAVLRNGKVVANYFPGRLVVDPKHRRKGIARALVLDYFRHHPDERPHEFQAPATQRIMRNTHAILKQLSGEH